MENFLRKIKLIDDFSITLKTTKSEFVSTLRSNVDEANIDSLFSGFFEVFESSKNIFKGEITNSNFKIRKRRKFFDRQFGFAKAIGNYSQKDDYLTIKVEVNAWNNFMYFFFGFAVLFYLIFIFGFLGFANIDGDLSLMILPFILIHAVFMIGIPYFGMRSGVKKMKKEIEREFHFIVSKNIHSK